MWMLKCPRIRISLYFGAMGEKRSESSLIKSILGLGGPYSSRQKTGRVLSITKARNSEDEKGSVEIMEHFRAFFVNYGNPTTSFM